MRTLKQSCMLSILFNNVKFSCKFLQLSTFGASAQCQDSSLADLADGGIAVPVAMLLGTSSLSPPSSGGGGFLWWPIVVSLGGAALLGICAFFSVAIRQGRKRKEELVSVEAHSLPPELRNSWMDREGAQGISTEDKEAHTGGASKGEEAGRTTTGIANLFSRIVKRQSSNQKYTAAITNADPEAVTSSPRPDDGRTDSRFVDASHNYSLTTEPSLTVPTGLLASDSIMRSLQFQADQEVASADLSALAAGASSAGRAADQSDSFRRAVTLGLVRDLSAKWSPAITHRVRISVATSSLTSYPAGNCICSFKLKEQPPHKMKYCIRQYLNG